MQTTILIYDLNFIYFVNNGAWEINDILLNSTFIVSSTPKQNLPVSCEISSKYLPKKRNKRNINKAISQALVF